MSISSEDLAIIRQQLGRQPRGIADIVVRSENGIPLVLQMRSLVDDQPFPTLYWLCSKDLRKAVGRIEGRGWVKTIEHQLQVDTGLRLAYLKDQQRYVALRWQVMHPDDRQRITAKGLSPLFDSYGIGGIKQWDKVRCLHMQYAHHLVDSNQIGRQMDKTFGLNHGLIKS